MSLFSLMKELLGSFSKYGTQNKMRTYESPISSNIMTVEVDITS